MRVFRLRTLDESLLRHSELVRRLGLPSSISITCVLCVPLFVFVIMPFSLFSLAGPSSLIALLLAFLIVILTTAHLSELACAVPKNCVAYHSAYAMVGELPALCLAWISLLDSVIISSLLITAWSNHLNLLFRRGIHSALKISVFSESSVFGEDYDLTCLLAVITALIILSCSLRVLGTVSLCFLAVTILIVASCTMVAFFHGDPQNWIDANFFSFGMNGMLHSISAMLIGFCGIEGMSYMVEETKSPRSRLPRLFPVLTVCLSIGFFLVLMIISLSINVSSISPSTLIPELFTLLNVPAARYMLTVASVCGLSGAVLASFLPGSRIIAALSKDGLLPVPVDKSLRSPFVSLTVFSLIVLTSFLIKTDVLFEIILLTTPLKLISIVLLTYLQHYRPEPIGIPHETSQYKSLSKRDSRGVLRRVSLDESQLSMDTGVFVQMNIAQVETQRLQKRLERKQQKEFDENVPVLTKSVSQYNSMSTTPYASGLIAINHGHDCIADSCETNHEDGSEDNCVHLYQREVPEIPFCNSYHGSLRSSTPIDMEHEYKKAQRALWLYIVAASSISLIFTRTAQYTISTSVLLALFVLILFISILIISQIATNDYLYRRHSKMPLFPYMSLFTIFLLLVPISTTKSTITVPFTMWLAAGLLIYVSYGVWNSVEKDKREPPPEVHRNEAYLAILGDNFDEK